MNIEADEYKLLPPLIEEEVVEESEEQNKSERSEIESDLFSDDANDSDSLGDLDLSCLTFPNINDMVDCNADTECNFDITLPPLETLKFDWL